MLGGAFNTLAAPLLFSRIIEYPIVLVLAVRRGHRSASGRSWWLNDLGVPIGVGALSAGLMVWLHPGGGSAQVFVAVLGLPALLAFTQSRAPVPICRVRRDDAGGRFACGEYARAGAIRQPHVLRRPSCHDGSGRSISLAGSRHHAARHASGRSVASGEALTYFHRQGPIGQAFAGLPAVAARRAVAVVGLGVGTLASYRTPGEQWTFYEIDPEVERIARTGSYFTYLGSCGDSCRVVLGDARLSLARAPMHGTG